MRSRSLAPVHVVSEPTERGARRREAWRAETVDGEWLIERSEEAGTPWLVFHRPSGLLATECPTLRAARAEIASGCAMRYAMAKAVSLLLTGRERTYPTSGTVLASARLLADASAVTR